MDRSRGNRWLLVAFAAAPPLAAVLAAAAAGLSAAGLPAVGLSVLLATLFALRFSLTRSGGSIAAAPPSPAGAGEWADGMGDVILRENLTSLGRLASGVAHEFGNPLTTISSVAQLLQRRRREDAFVREQSEIIQTHVRRLSRLSRLMVDLSFPKMPGLADFDLHRLLDDTLQVARLDTRIKEADVQLDVEEGALHVRADEGGVHLILLNLLFNAADALDGKGEIRVRTSRSDLGVELRVQDDGPGIPEEIRTRIFAPFYSTKPAGAGTGMGLPISCRLARSMGGELNLLETGRQGTCFLLLLPSGVGAA